MIQQSQFLSQPCQMTPIMSQTASHKKVNVYFTYQSSPQPSVQQNLKVIKQQQEEKRRKKIFQPRRKLSYQQLSESKRRSSRLRIFDQKVKRPSTMNSPFLIKKKDCDIIINKYRSGIFTNENSNEYDRVLKRNNTQEMLQSVNKPFYERSPIYLKDSVISGVQTIVDQLQDLQPQIQQQHNPINKKLSQIKNRRQSITKRTFYSNTVKNSLMIMNNNKNNNNNQNGNDIVRRNRIDSEVLTYQYSPNQKYRSSVTIKAASRPYGMSKFSNGLSILTNDNNHNNLFEDFQFQDNQNVQTPKYHKSTYKSVLRKSFEPSMNNKLDISTNSKQKLRKNNLLDVNNHPQTDRFYDQSSIQTPRLPVVSKKISYEVIDPLTSSLKKQKLERIQLRKISETVQIKKPAQNKIKTFFLLILSLITQLVSKTTNNAQKGTQCCFKFLKSQLFFLIVIVMLSLTIFAIQLIQ